MIRIYRALVASEVIVWALVAWTGATANGASTAVSRHVTLAVLAALLAALAHTMPFFFLMGSFYWLKACVDRAGADSTVLAEHKRWVASPALPALLGSALLTILVVVSGGLVQAGRVPPSAHISVVLTALALHVFAAWYLPKQMRRISALLSDMRAWLPPAEALRDLQRRRPELAADPTLGRPVRTLLLMAPQPLLLWLYLRFGTDAAPPPVWPFALAAIVLACWAWRHRRVRSGRKPGEQLVSCERRTVSR